MAVCSLRPIFRKWCFSIQHLFSLSCFLIPLNKLKLVLHLPAKMVNTAVQMEGRWSLVSLPLPQTNKIQGSLGVEASQTQVQVPKVRKCVVNWFNLAYLPAKFCLIFFGRRLDTVAVGNINVDKIVRWNKTVVTVIFIGKENWTLCFLSHEQILQS